MRPVDRGNSPQATDYADYRDAFPSLLARLGPYCSYCERRIPTNLAVEHIQPKGLDQYKHLIGAWHNFVLGCVNCNGTKTDKDVLLDQTYIPDRDNTCAALSYLEDGRILPSAQLTSAQRTIAEDSLKLTGPDKSVREVRDANGKLIAMDRISQRMEVFLIALRSRKRLSDREVSSGQMDEVLRETIVDLALAQGFFSVWMTVYQEDPIMRRCFIAAFPGTAIDCFDPVTTTCVSPRPGNGLQHGGKI